MSIVNGKYPNKEHCLYNHRKKTELLIKRKIQKIKKQYRCDANVYQNEGEDAKYRILNSMMGGHFYL
jgi:hypothetical protein